jgi:hypothetical protein
MQSSKQFRFSPVCNLQAKLTCTRYFEPPYRPHLRLNSRSLRLVNLVAPRHSLIRGSCRRAQVANQLQPRLGLECVDGWLRYWQSKVSLLLAFYWEMRL